MPRSKEKQLEYEKEQERKRIAKNTKSKLRKDIFVANVMNVNNPKTFCNYRQSALAAHPGVTPGTAGNAGSDYMKDSYVLSEIERIVEELGLGYQNRVRFLREIILGTAERETIQHVRDKETGEWLPMQKQVSTPSFKERISALQELNALDGTKEKTKAIVTERNKFLAKMRKKLLKQIDEDSRHEVLPTKSCESTNSSKKTSPEQSSSELDAFLTGSEIGESQDTEKS